VAGGGKLDGGLSGRDKKTMRQRELVDDGALEEISLARVEALLLHARKTGCSLDFRET
jgi:hypothetical protein